ncbi:hypothetical protein NDU88_002122 [Pleurodeles waltl]|uniref:Uncharacterized protein n=1 Tax=Pleurodeles waltl TaxID=8319 RepID=A0AAV7WKC4_PLEWA|nr:hypothetical protein NDU88_002122 [Pleurodeles waltl]
MGSTPGALLCLLTLRRKRWDQFGNKNARKTRRSREAKRGKKNTVTWNEEDKTEIRSGRETEVRRTEGTRNGRETEVRRTEGTRSRKETDVRSTQETNSRRKTVIQRTQETEEGEDVQELATFQEERGHIRYGVVTGKGRKGNKRGTEEASTMFVVAHG